MRIRPCSLFLLCLLLPLGSATAANDPMTGFPVVEPEAVGFSTERLKRLDAAIQRTIDNQDFAGVVVLAARHGKLFLSRTYGVRDTETHDPVQVETIFRLYSMSKPLTGIAMLQLYEQGKWSGQDPISKYIPEFAHLQVVKGYDSAGQPILEEPKHAPMMRELMTHTAGFADGGGKSADDRLYQDSNGKSVMQSASNLQEMIHRLAKAPLIYQPGEHWVYGISVDIQGYLVEKLSGETFPDYAQHHIFGPLGMKDTGFYVPHDKLGRFTPNYTRTDAGKLVHANPDLGGPFDVLPGRPSGGGGMVGTAPDYLKAAQMFLNRGEFRGVRVLAPSSVELMSSNHLAARLQTGEWGGGIHRIRPGLGWGYDFAVYTDPALADETTGKGTFMWLGAAGTVFWVDPANDLVFVAMVQRLASDERPNLEALTRQTFYQALLDPTR